MYIHLWQVVATGRRKFFYVVDLGQARLERVPGLLGRPEKSFETFAACPAEEAPLLAFLGNQGCIPLFSLRSRQAIGDLKMNGSARAAAFSADASHLFTSGAHPSCACALPLSPLARPSQC